ncbi:MAG TPA: S1/P1 nuclease, partial [Magnetospirillaceae bacterium]|nr:S1/P1 nuclease [Magnetospirillaceae bacterium]
MPRLPSLALFLALLLCLPGRGQAWGVTGHAIIADIAEHHLTPQALAEIQALLREEGLEHLDQVSSWPDTIRKERPEASPWHYVAIPLSAASYDPERDCKNGDCSIEAIKRFSAILADRAQTPLARREALKFLVHIVGDQHMPLHGADNAGDHEGGDVKVVYFGQDLSGDRPLSLH